MVSNKKLYCRFIYFGGDWVDRKQVIEKVGSILDTYCNGCFLIHHHRKEYGKKYAQSFCNNKCTVGCELQKYGKILS